MPMVREDVLYTHPSPLLSSVFIRCWLHVLSMPLPLRDAAADDASDRDYGLAEAYWIGWKCCFHSRYE